MNFPIVFHPPRHDLPLYCGKHCTYGFSCSYTQLDFQHKQRRATTNSNSKSRILVFLHSLHFSMEQRLPQQRPGEPVTAETAEWHRNTDEVGLLEHVVVGGGPRPLHVSRNTSMEGSLGMNAPSCFLFLCYTYQFDYLLVC